MQLAGESQAMLIKYAVVGALVLGAAWYLRRQAAAGLTAAADAVDGVLEAVNPTSSENVAYRATNAVGGAIAGERHWSLGAWIWEVTHPAEVARERSLTAPTPAPSVTFEYVGGGGSFRGNGATGSW